MNNNNRLALILLAIVSLNNLVAMEKFPELLAPQRPFTRDAFPRETLVMLRKKRDAILRCFKEYQENRHKDDRKNQQAADNRKNGNENKLLTTRQDMTNEENEHQLQSRKEFEQRVIALSDEAFNEAPEAAVATVFNERDPVGITAYSVLKKIADSAHWKAVYLTCRAHKNKETREGHEFLLNYLPFATREVPEAYAWLIELEDDMEALVRYCVSAYDRLRSMTLEEGLPFIARISQRLSSLWEKNDTKINGLIIGPLLTWLLVERTTEQSLLPLLMQLQTRKSFDGFEQAVAANEDQLIKYATQDPVGGHAIGTLLWGLAQEQEKEKAQDLKNKAWKFWQRAEAQGHVPASWSLLAFNSECDGLKTGDLIAIVRHIQKRLAAKALSKEAVSAREDSDEQLVGNKIHIIVALRKFETTAQTAEQLDAVATMYVHGITGLIDADEKRAIERFKAAYVFSVYADIETNSEKVAEYFKTALVNLGKGVQTEQVVRRKALMEVLNDMSAHPKGSLDALIMLAQINICGIPGIERNPSALFDICQQAGTIMNDAESLKKFLNKTHIADLIGNPEYEEVQSIILACVFASSEPLNPGQIEDYIKRIGRLMERQAHKDQKYALDNIFALLEGMVMYSFAQQDVYVACYCAYHALRYFKLDDYNCSPNSQLLKSNLSIFDELRSLLKIRCSTQVYPFFIGDSSCRMLIEELATLLDPKTTSRPEPLMPYVCSAYALLITLCDAQYMDERFLKGISLLVKNDDDVCKKILEDMRFVLHLHVHKPTTEQGLMQAPCRRLDLYHSISALLRCEGFALSSWVIFNEALVFAKFAGSHVYEKWCEEHDPHKLEQLPVGKLIAQSKKAAESVIEGNIYGFVSYFAHYRLLARITTHEEKKKSYIRKSIEMHARGLAANPLLMNLFLAVEFMKDVILPSNAEVATTYFKAAARLMEERSQANLLTDEERERYRKSVDALLAEFAKPGANEWRMLYKELRAAKQY